MTDLWTIGSLLKWTEGFFAEKGIDTPRLDAEILLAHVLEKERIYLYAHFDEPMTSTELSAYKEMIKKRAARYPVAHILGIKPFMGLDFIVNEHVLVPRPETELLVEAVLEICPKEIPVRVLDMGTGSGAILLSLLSYLPQATGTGVDISSDALKIAAENGEALHIKRVQWVNSDLFTNVEAHEYDWLVSNPPYLTAPDMQNLEEEVKYDPQTALYGGTDGLDIYRRLAGEGGAYLKVGGHSIVEVGAGQSRQVAELFTDQGFELVRIIKDYADTERHVLLRKKG